MIEAAALIGLAAWRVTSLLSREAGPGGVFLRFRSLLGFRHAENGIPEAWPDNVVANALACPLCLSVWIAAAMYGIWRLEPWVVAVIAAAGVAAAIVEAVKRVGD